MWGAPRREDGPVLRLVEGVLSRSLIFMKEAIARSEELLSNSFITNSKLCQVHK
jgi:hypothetical protein